LSNRPDYVKTIDEIQIIPGAGGLAQAARLDCLFVVATNQSASAAASLTMPALIAINAHVNQPLLRPAGAWMAGTFARTCPEGCDCRKPKPGMLVSAAADLQIDLPASVMIGDALSDAGQPRRRRSIWSAPAAALGRLRSWPSWPVWRARGRRPGRRAAMGDGPFCARGTSQKRPQTGHG
jgi:hypothetical protein